MKRISRDVERLMWLVAEDRDPKAIADFESRFPELKYDLARHITMVNGLKSAGRKIPAHAIPRFEPRYPRQASPFQRPMLLAATFVLAALGFGTYAAVTLFGPPPAKTQPPITPPAPVVGPIRTPGADAVPGGAPSGPPPIMNQPSPSGVQPGPSVAPLADDPSQKLITLKLGQIPLAGAIQSVCSLAGIQAEIAPGLAPVEVSFDYEARPVAEVLADLGRKYGFTAIPQEPGHVLIIPVRPDGEGPRAGVPGGPAVSKPVEDGGR